MPDDGAVSTELLALIDRYLIAAAQRRRLIDELRETAATLRRDRLARSAQDQMPQDRPMPA